MADFKYMDLFDGDDKALASKVLDYLDGDSKEHLSKFLQLHRKNAIKKGMIPRTRNLVKMVAEKSGMLFNGKAPMLNVYLGDNVDEVASATVQLINESADWVEFFNNFDVTLRLLKTQYVLVQVDPPTKRFVYTALDQSNSAVVMDTFKTPIMLIYRTGKRGDNKLYRVWTPVEYFDLEVDKHGNEERVPGSTEPNPYGGMIPIAQFNDTSTPREGAWNEIPEDLVEINDIYNLHITDSEYAAMWAKQPTLFTNAKIQGGTGATMESVQMPDEALPRWVPSSDPGFIGGPGTVVAVESDDANVYLEYKGPMPPLKELDDIVLAWVDAFARDWSVSIQADTGQVQSGWALTVKELPNLELRKKRARMYEAGFHRLYDVLVTVAGSVGISLPVDGELWVDFGQPDLPIDEKMSEEVWSRKIAEKRATRVDYFMEVRGMSRAEAEAKVAEIDATLPPAPARPGLVTATPEVVTTTVRV